MIEAHGNMWDMPADVHVITTNGDINARGRAVMGRGCAQQARDMFPGIDSYLGEQLRAKGNHVLDIGTWTAHRKSYRIFSFPVKVHWPERASTWLIQDSADELVELADAEPELQRIILPRPGCGNGQLTWEWVRPLLEDVLDDRFVVVTR
jgi:hypothetical protein